MSMISELVDRLRTEAKFMGTYGTDYMATLLMRSADTIVLLSEKARETKQGENATRCYEFLKTKLGEGIVDSKKEFESWYERMVWHVKECDKLARELKQGEWIQKKQSIDGKYDFIWTECSECHQRPHDESLAVIEAEVE